MRRRPAHSAIGATLIGLGLLLTAPDSVASQDLVRSGLSADQPLSYHSFCPVVEQLLQPSWRNLGPARRDVGVPANVAFRLAGVLQVPGGLWVWWTWVGAALVRELAAVWIRGVGSRSRRVDVVPGPATRQVRGLGSLLGSLLLQPEPHVRELWTCPPAPLCSSPLGRRLGAAPTGTRSGREAANRCRYEGPHTATRPSCTDCSFRDGECRRRRQRAVRSEAPTEGIDRSRDADTTGRDPIRAREHPENPQAEPAKARERAPGTNSQREPPEECFGSEWPLQGTAIGLTQDLRIDESRGVQEPRHDWD